MALKPPAYIPVKELSKIDVIGTWDSGDPYENLADVSEETVDRLSSLSNRGVMAYSIGCAYWVIYRFSDKADIGLLLKYIEASLPCLFAFSDRVPNELNQDEWIGPVRGPLQFSVFLVADTWYSGEFDVPAEQGARSEQLVFYTIPEECRERNSFLMWREIVLSRLEKYFSRDPDNPDGLGVAIDVMDPGVEIDLGMNLDDREYRLRMANTLSQIDRDNYFLSDLIDFNMDALLEEYR
jgi:hypothetical protein